MSILNCLQGVMIKGFIMTMNFLDALKHRVLVCDGAMGTMLYSGGVFLNRAFEELNLSEPERVASVHRSYVNAGADVIESNTFGCNALKLETFGLSNKIKQINDAGVRLAREVAGDKAYVAGAIGPLGVLIDPYGRTTQEEAESYFYEHASLLGESGVDLFMLETFCSLDELLIAVRALKKTKDLPVVAQLTMSANNETTDGASPEVCARKLEDEGVSVIGLNCGSGPASMLEIVKRIASVAERPLSVQPNAGMPRLVEGRTMYLSSPDYLASYSRRFVNCGARLVGGCCGTTPDHITQIRSAVSCGQTGDAL